MILLKSYLSNSYDKHQYFSHPFNLDMIFKNTFIAVLFTVVTFNFAAVVQAQEIRTLKDYVNNCIPENEEDEVSQECDRLREENQVEAEAEFEPVRTDSKPSNKLKGYAGGTLGVFFPDVDEDTAVFPGNDTDVNTGFGSSLYGGIRFNRFLSTDLELGAFSGDIDSDLDEDENYIVFTLFLNPRFTLPLTGKENSIALYLSPGIGISQLASSLEDEVDDFDRTTIIEDDTRFTWQLKTGVSIPVSSKVSVIVQGRYASQTGDDAIDYFGTELGANYDF